ncbi:unnamed protein product [Linum trigynum]|uniref:Endonuclease/exonuclease/phosphatase domain-containing protein n=1 Tax=Linum trigynum TaxID=586398 RepID=A0AAV2CUL1_9ROSI
MKLLCYNCRGLGSMRAVRSLKSLLRQAFPHVMFLMETCQLCDENEKTRLEIGYKNGKSWPTDTSNGGRAGGLSIWWNDEVQITVMDHSQHHIDDKVVDELAGEWRFTGVYGWPEGIEKERTWHLLRQLAEQWTGPWLCGGDLNQVLSDFEKKGGNLVAEEEMRAFSDCLVDVGLQDMGFSGYPYTWENRRRSGGYIEERLDRFLANEGWRKMWPNARVSHLGSTRSDHQPILCES